LTLGMVLMGLEEREREREDNRQAHRLVEKWGEISPEHIKKEEQKESKERKTKQNKAVKEVLFS